MFGRRISFILFIIIMLFSCLVNAGYPLIIKTDMGVVSVPVKPLRVITLEHRYTEMVLSLGVVPVGVADINSYRHYDGILASELTLSQDIGTRASPSLEAIHQLKPDLIIGTRLRNEAVYSQLKKIAPTLLYDGIEITTQEYSQFHQLHTEFEQVAEALDKKDEGQQVWKKFITGLSIAKDRINQAMVSGKLGTKHVAVGQFLPGSPKIRLFTADAVVMQVLNEIGLLAGWETQGGVGSYGYKVVDVGALRGIDSAYFLYINERADDNNLRRIVSNPAWHAFPFVKAKRDRRMPEDIWPWGGPLAVARFVDIVTKTVNSNAG